MESEASFDRSERRPISGGRAARAAHPGAGCNPVILYVDDEPDLLTILRLFLCAQGFEVIPAVNALEALQLVTQRRPDLIITDSSMPGMSGLELCRTLRARADTRSIPIILYSGKDIWEEDNPPPFDHVVLKPADLDILVRTIRALLAGSAPQ
jgi:two-component system phosphate regulon response regulator PhoB